MWDCVIGLFEVDETQVRALALDPSPPADLIKSDVLSHALLKGAEASLLSTNSARSLKPSGDTLNHQDPHELEEDFDKGYASIIVQ